MRNSMVAALLGVLFVVPAAPAKDGDANFACLVKRSPRRADTYRITGNDELDSFLRAEQKRLRKILAVEPHCWLVADTTPSLRVARSRNRKRWPNYVTLGVTHVREKLWRSEHREAMVGAMLAHGHAHVLQWKEKSTISGPARELQADFLTGYYVGKRNYASLGDDRKKAAAFVKQFIAMSGAHLGKAADREDALLGGWEERTKDLAAAYRESFDAYKPEPAPAPEPKEEPEPEPEPEPAKKKIIVQPKPVPVPAAEPPKPEGGIWRKIRVRCTHKVRCVHRTRCKHKMPCVHRIPCRHEIPCTHKIPCRHRVQCRHRRPCQHRVACCHPKHEYDLLHAFDVDPRTGRRVPCRHKTACVHRMHQYDLLHEWDYDHEYDTLHRFDLQHRCDFKHQYDLLHNWDPAHDWDYEHEFDLAHAFDEKWVER